MSSLAGQTFAGYEVLAKLGEGGMGSVFKARQPALNRLVALKVMATQLGSDSMFVSRFRREANAAAALNHENIVQVFSAGESEGTHYIAMEFVEGKTLRQHIDSHGKLDPREAIAITVYVAKALQYAWNKAKLIHRDIKPENIFLSNTGEVKVGDLGLAKTVGGETTSLTQTGMMMGSPNYISPEQARGLSDIDFRTDIYSLGCTLYHMLTGRPPYSGSDPLVVITKHVNDPPPAIFKVWPTCPIPLALAMGKMLTKNRNDRPASYEDLIAQLQEVHDKLKPAATVAPVTGSESAKASAATPTPKPASATPRPSVAKTPTAVPKTKPTRWSSGSSVLWLGRQKPELRRKMFYTAAGVALVALMAGTVWWFAGRAPTAQVDDAFVLEVAALPAEQQATRVVAKLKELNPQFDAALAKHKIENDAVVELSFPSSEVTDISPVAALKQLRVFECNGRGQAVSKLCDFSPLRGLSLTQLKADWTGLEDLSPLHGMPIRTLSIQHTRVSDLSVLAGMPLNNLELAGTLVNDIAPLANLPLVRLHLHGCKTLRDLSPLRGRKITWLCFAGTQVEDLSPLRGMPLAGVVCNSNVLRSPQNLAVLRAISTLKGVNNGPAAKFWQQVDSGQLQTTTSTPEQEQATTEPNASTTSAMSAATQQPRQTIDLLALTDAVNDRIMPRGVGKANIWERRGRSLVYVSDGKAGKVAPPVAIRARSYEIEVEFERSSGKGHFHLDLPLEDGRIIPIYLDKSGAKLIAQREGAAWPAGRPGRGRVSVRLDRGANGAPDRLSARLDDEALPDWQGDIARFTVTPEPYPQFPGQPLTSFFCFSDSYEVRSWQLRVFDGEATVLRGSAAMTADLPKETSVDLGGGVTMELVLVPAGEFMMGSNDGPANEKPVHKVRISAPFYTGKYEVTVGQFKRFVAETQYQTEAERFNNGWMNTSRGWGPVPGVNWRTPVKFTQADDHPVCVVSRNDIQEFCKWASKQTGQTVRLPTEAQWEYACRAGTTTRFNTTDKDSELGEAAWFAANSGQRTHPVGQKKPNAWGLYDMHGNLYEMVQDFYSDKYDAEQFVVDPQGSTTGGGRQMRGGGWGNVPASVRSACRKKIGLDEASIGNGFRVVTDAPPAGGSVASTSNATGDAAWQNAINLLPLVDLSQDVNSGKWEAAPDGLKATDIKNMSQKIQPPCRPPEEYDYRVSFTPMSGNADVAIGLTAKGRSFVFYMKKYATDHCLGFEAISGKAIARGPTAHRFPHLEMGSRYTVVVEVRKNGLRGYLDGKLVAEWATDYSDMTAWPVWRFKDDTLLGFGCSLSTVVFQEVRLREVSGKGTFTRGGPKP